MARFSERSVREAIEAAGGVIAEAARALGVSRSTMYNYFEKWPNLKDHVQVERDGLIDMAELNVSIAVHNGDMDASKFVLERLGRARGWTKQIDVGQAIPLTAEVRELLDKLGIAPDQIGTELLPVLRELAAAVEEEADGDS